MNRARHILLEKEPMSERRLDDGGFAVAERVPDAVVEQLGIVADEQPGQIDWAIRAIDSVDQLRHLDFQRPDDVRGDRSHECIVAKILQ
jgi:hypothetical protein